VKVVPVPAHVLAGSLCLGLALANLDRLHAVGLCGSLVAAAVLVAVDAPAVRLACAALFLVASGWWWASLRLDALDRSPLTIDVGRAGRAVVVVTAPARKGRFTVRAQGRVRSFAGRPVDEPVQLELPLGRAPPQGAILDTLALVRLPRGPSHGFDERTWLRRHGVHVVLRLDAWRQTGSRGGLGGLADRIRTRLERSIAPRLAGERRAVLEGIVLGDDSSLSDGLRQDFRASGLYHILSVE
jgi:competence protein ComEC